MIQQSYQHRIIHPRLVSQPREHLPGPAHHHGAAIRHILSIHFGSERRIGYVAQHLVDRYQVEPVHIEILAETPVRLYRENLLRDIRRIRLKCLHQPVRISVAHYHYIDTFPHRSLLENFILSVPGKVGGLIQQSRRGLEESLQVIDRVGESVIEVVVHHISFIIHYNNIYTHRRREIPIVASPVLNLLIHRDDRIVLGNGHQREGDAVVRCEPRNPQ